MRLSFSNKDAQLSQGANFTTFYSVDGQSVDVSMEAKLDASNHYVTDPTPNEHFRLFDWVRQSEIVADRKLQCSIISSQSGNHNCTTTIK